MTAPGNDALLITMLAVLAACLGYAGGRLHQWYRTGLDRDEAYRDGYDTATRSVFSMAARLISPRRAARGTAVVKSATACPVPSVTAPPAGLRPSRPGSPATPSAAVLRAADAVSARSESSPAETGSEPADDEGGGRHYVPDELVQAPTYRLTPDRVARAKVRGAAPGDGEAQETTRLPPSVPRPRSS